MRGCPAFAVRTGHFDIHNVCDMRYVCQMVSDPPPTASNPNVKSRREENAEATRQALLNVGRAAFCRSGFRDASVDEIARGARVTRGAFYHHFADKLALFDAIVVEMQVEMVCKVQASVAGDVLDRARFTIGMHAYLDVCLEPSYARIILQDARATLGDARFGEIERAHSIALIRMTLAAVQQQGRLQNADIEMLSQLVDAMLCRLGTTLSASDGEPAHRESGVQMIETFLDAYWPR